MNSGHYPRCEDYMKCQVRWINAQGQPTPDQNDAVMMAHYHEPIWRTPGPSNSIQGYSEVIRESFPICADHYAMVDASFRKPRGGWTFSPIAQADPIEDRELSAEVIKDLRESFNHLMDRFDAAVNDYNANDTQQS